MEHEKEKADSGTTPHADEHEIESLQQPPNDEMGEGKKPTMMSDLEIQKSLQGEAHFHRLGWKRMTIILIVQSIALGSLSIPKAFAILGMVPGVITCVCMGFVAIYAAFIVGLVKLKYPHVAHYVDAGQLLMGRFGERVFTFAFVILLVLVVGSHCLTGTIAFIKITGSSICSLTFGVVSAIILLLCAVPPSFTELAILGYIDFASILVAIGITIISTSIQDPPADAIPWSAWASPDLTFTEALVAISNIVFAYAFAGAQFSFMSEMHTPKDYTKSILALGSTQVLIYTITGAVIYSFVGQTVQSPALLSTSPLISKIAFGCALPVIFISGANNTTVVCRFLHGRIYKDTVVQYVNTTKGWVTWIITITGITILSWVVAEAIPFFSELLGLCAALFVSGFSFWIPQSCGSDS
uniref:Amino acid transporter transmembrane domain-containing protein n=1 Tax=Bionectria ochroleuca TaxID=29856 RepID=A0A8H7K0Z2_BIOOC